MQQIASLPTGELAILVMIVLAFATFGVTLLTVSLAVGSRDRVQRSPQPQPQRQVTSARGLAR